ncbi:MAG: hypothetical protein M3R24_24655 [Chloroflexota bacterium]|nr:hypothetical protein [Chloroflexota bacterium]
MTRQRVFSRLLLVALLSVTPVPTTWAEPQVPPLPTAAPVPTPHVRLRTAYTAFLRAAPAWRQDGDREVLPRGTEIEVRAVVPDGSERLGGYWYHVQALPAGRAPRGGWLHSTVVYLTPTQLAGLTPEASTTPTATAAVVEPLPTTLPSATPVTTPTTRPTMAVPLALRVCYDLHANKTCDVDEGIAGVRVYGTDATTGQLLVAAVTDAGGVAQLRWHAPAADARARLILTMPYFGEVRTVTPTQTSVDPVLITALAPIPAWLP